MLNSHHLPADRCFKPSRNALSGLLSAAPRSAQMLSWFDCQLKDAIIWHIALCISLRSCSHALLTKKRKPVACLFHRRWRQSCFCDDALSRREGRRNDGRLSFTTRRQNNLCDALMLGRMLNSGKTFREHFFKINHKSTNQEETEYSQPHPACCLPTETT